MGDSSASLEFALEICIIAGGEYSSYLYRFALASSLCSGIIPLQNPYTGIHIRQVLSEGEPPPTLKTSNLQGVKYENNQPRSKVE